MLPKRRGSAALSVSRATVTQALDANVPNPYNIANLASLAATNPALYNWISTNGFFTGATIPRNRLLRPFSQYATGGGLVFGDQPLGEARVQALQINGTRRFANGFTANVALAFTKSENTRTVEDTMREALAIDKTRSQVFEIGPLGIMQITRKRVSGGLVDSFSETCPQCEGRGIIVNYDAS